MFPVHNTFMHYNAVCTEIRTLDKFVPYYILPATCHICFVFIYVEVIICHAGSFFSNIINYRFESSMFQEFVPQSVAG